LASEPDWLSPEEVGELNQIAVEQTGEPYILRDAGLLESACFSARHHWLYDDTAAIPDLAGVLLLALARNHPFAQGNKRTAFAAAR
jgi:death-on-curing protein